MTASGWVHLDFTRIVRETDKAFLVELEEHGQKWIPKSCVCDHEDYSAGDKNGTISVSEWFAEKEELT